MDLRPPCGLALPTSAVEEAATHFGLSVLEDGRAEPLHWRNLLEEGRCKGTLLDMHSSLVAGLTCNLCSEIVHEPVLYIGVRVLNAHLHETRTDAGSVSALP